MPGRPPIRVGAAELHVGGVRGDTAGHLTTGYHPACAPPDKGHQISNAALDNSTGSAWLLERAGAFRKLPPAPRRSVLFVAGTGEEKGLLSAKYYATHRLYPPAKTAADIN